MAVYVTPLAARTASCLDALVRHDARTRMAALLPHADQRPAFAASLATYEADCSAAHAVYDCAIAAQTRAAIAYDRAHYEAYHGELPPGEDPWGHDLIEGVRTDLEAIARQVA